MINFSSQFTDAMWKNCPHKNRGKSFTLRLPKSLQVQFLPNLSYIVQLDDFNICKIIILSVRE